MFSLKETAYGKINLYLDILGKRKDGYHEIRTLFQTISLADELTLEKTESEVSISCKNKDLQYKELPCDKNNLIYKAAHLLKSETECKNGVKVILEKRIPLSAGLGGGSSDAAATIKGLNKLWELNLTREKMLEIAEKLGSDVPFFMIGGTLLAQGRGEKFISFLPTPDLWVIVLKPGFSISTPWAYGQWKPKKAKKVDFQSLLDNLKEDKILGKGLLYNSFENIIENKYPLIKSLKETLKNYGINDCLLSGSGSSVFGLTKDLESAKKVEDFFKEKQDVFCFITKTVKGSYK